MANVSDEKLRRKIKEILKDADLSTLSAKKVRLELQQAFDIDLSERKKEIDKMTMTLIMEMEEKKKSEEKEDSEEEEEEEQNGQGKSGSDSDQEEEPPKKKTKMKEKPEKKKEKKKKRKEGDDDDDDDLAPLENDDLMAYDEEQKTLKLSDEELAKRLQSFEETGRRTRGKATPKRKEKKKGGGGSTNSPYSRPCILSPELAGVVGTDKLARNEIVKKMWEIVKERKLQDPKDKRFMICDEQLQKVFGRKRVKTFGMMKYLSSHLRDESSSLEAVITNSDIYDDEADDD